MCFQRRSVYFNGLLMDSVHTFQSTETNKVKESILISKSKNIKTHHHVVDPIDTVTPMVMKMLVLSESFHLSCSIVNTRLTAVLYKLYFITRQRGLYYLHKRLWMLIRIRCHSLITGMKTISIGLEHWPNRQYWQGYRFLSSAIFNHRCSPRCVWHRMTFLSPKCQNYGDATWRTQIFHLQEWLQNYLSL